VENVSGSTLADTAAIHLAASTPPEHRLASWLGQRHLTVDPVPSDQGARNRGGLATSPDAPGLAVAPDPDILGKPVAIHGDGA
jgi:L-alanine-DL-glutamate epimerase-like enolase superfamily enzyme